MWNIPLITIKTWQHWWKILYNIKYSTPTIKSFQRKENCIPTPSTVEPAILKNRFEYRIDKQFIVEVSQ